MQSNPVYPEWRNLQWSKLWRDPCYSDPPTNPHHYHTQHERVNLAPEHTQLESSDPLLMHSYKKAYIVCCTLSSGLLAASVASHSISHFLSCRVEIASSPLRLNTQNWRLGSLRSFAGSMPCTSLEDRPPWTTGSTPSCSPSIVSRKSFTNASVNLSKGTARW